MPDPVEKFRQLTGRRHRRRSRPKHPDRPPVPPRETALLAILLLNVAFLAFAMGGVYLWSQWIALALSFASLAFLPRWSHGELKGQRPPVLRLLASPVFLLGLGLMILFWIHSWNLAWDWTTAPNGRPRLVPQTPPVPWLPAGLESPMDGRNPFRSMIFYAIPWLACCAAWAGLNTRRSVAFLLHGITWLGIAYAGIALYQHFVDAPKILGLFETVPGRRGTEIPFWGTLINGNHAALFLILINGLCLGLFLSSWDRALRQFKRGGGAYLLYLACSLPVTFAVLLAQARGAIVVLGLQWIFFLVICSFFFLRRFGLRGAAFPVILFAGILFIIFSFITNPDVFERQKKEWTVTFSLVENPEVEARTHMYAITRDMVADKPWFGHGAGGWRYLHLPYLAEYPDFNPVTYRWFRDPDTGKRERREIQIWFQNAHVDLMEYLVEWGVLGAFFPVALFLILLIRAAVHARGWDFGMLTILMSAFLVLAAAAIEFHFRIPLVLITWWLVFLALVRLGDLRAASPTPSSPS